MRVSVYLLFAGTCRPAMEFYREVLGGELTLTTVGDSPLKGVFPPAFHTRVLNARLQSERVDMSASDWLQPAEAHVRGNMNCLYVSGGTPDETRAVFLRLSDGGVVTDPLAEQPFGLYGALNDRFGVRWMLHADL